MSDYQRCKRCGEYGWTGESAQRFGFHTCLPMWECRIAGNGDDWDEVYAREAEQAAEKFCDQYDSNGDYTIIQAGEAEVDVRRPGEDEITQWKIAAESVPHYRAYPKTV